MATLKHLATENKRVRRDREALRNHTLMSIDFNSPTNLEDEIARYGNTRIALMGNVETIDELLKKRGFANVENIGAIGSGISENLFDYDVICLLHKRFAEVEAARIGASRRVRCPRRWAAAYCQRAVPPRRKLQKPGQSSRHPRSRVRMAIAAVA